MELVLLFFIYIFLAWSTSGLMFFDKVWDLWIAGCWNEEHECMRVKWACVGSTVEYMELVNVLLEGSIVGAGDEQMRSCGAVWVVVSFVFIWGGCW